MTEEAVAMSYSRSRFLVARWAIFALLIASYMLVFFHRMAPAVVSADLMREFGTSGAALGSLAAMYFYIYTLMQIPAGVLADTLGARMTLSCGNLLAGLGSLLFGLGESFAMVSIGRALVGLGVSVVFVGLFKNNSLWFRARDFGLVSGLSLLFGNLGAMAAAAPLAAALEYYSWRSIFVTLGLCTLALAVLTLCWVRNRPEDLGFPSMRQMEGTHAPEQGRSHWWLELLAVLRTRAVWPPFFVDMGMVGGMLAFIGLWAIPYLRDVHGLGRSEGALYTTVALGGFALGSLVLGWLSDRMGRRKPVILVGTLLYVMSCLGFAFMAQEGSAVLMLLFALMGFGCGGFIVSFACAKEVVPPGSAGMAVGLVNMGLFFGAACMQPLFGWTLDRLWAGQMRDSVRIYESAAYQEGFVLMLIFSLVALAAACMIRETGPCTRQR